MKRAMIHIDEELCTGCGACIPNCPEGALEVIDGKARLVSELRCDGLGACVGECPEGAMTVEEREAEPYDERRVIEAIIPQGLPVIQAHVQHLEGHDQTEELKVAFAVLQEEGIELPHGQGHGPAAPPGASPLPCGCPGSAARSFDEPAPPAEAAPADPQPSRLGHWPIQLHLIAPTAPCYQGRDVVLSADCVAYSLGAFHRDWLQGKSLAIACPKLDSGQEGYKEKITALIDEARINTLTVMIMEVPCCTGLLRLAQDAVAQASRKVPIRAVRVSVRGEILTDTWL